MLEWLDWLWQSVSEVAQVGLPGLGVWGYVLLALLVATEGPLSTLIGAAAAAAGYLDVWWVFVAAAVGNIVGDTVWYTLGYLGKMDVVLRYGSWLGIRHRHLDRLRSEMHAHAIKLILFAKVAYGLIVPTLVAAGMARVPWRRWFPVVFVVETIWSIFLVWVGYHAAGMIVQLERGLRFVGIGVLILGVFGFAWYLRQRKRKARDIPLLEVNRRPVESLVSTPFVQNPAHDSRQTMPEYSIGRPPDLASGTEAPEHKQAETAEPS